MKKEECKYCGGRGQVRVYEAEDDIQIKKCHFCKGEGKVYSYQQFDADILTKIRHGIEVG